ncbi:MAG: helix-turn-helix domain-containing protein [Candidatus Thiodiazotropha taylori]|nr:helix-turn-helix domain-containing protein [Candidatus Thiodiazotropha taylori]
MRHVYYIVHMTFGKYVREVRERRRSEDRTFSVRQVAQRIGVEPAYLSKIEREQVAPPSEDTIRRLAGELGEDSDLLLAMAGKVSSDLQAIILRRPRLFADLLRQLKEVPDDAILRVVREIRDGDW